MVTLRVIVDSVLEERPRGLARYAQQLTLALIATAPRDCDVEGIIPASSETDYAELDRRLPGLAGLHKSALARRDLYAAWQHGITTVPGMIHSPTLLAPLRSHSRTRRPGTQVAVTIHDGVPWSFPESGRRSGWVRAMARRAQKHADAIVVPTHAVAAELDDRLGIGSRIRVIGGAPSLTPPPDPDAVAARLDLPPDYLLAVGDLDPHKAIRELLAALALPEVPDVPLILVGVADAAGPTLDALVTQAGLPAGRVRVLGPLRDDELAVAMQRTALFLQPSRAEGFGLSMLEAFALGAPVLHSDAPALLEVSDGAGRAVMRGSGEGYSERLADAIAQLLRDAAARERLSVLGMDRARAFDWHDSAEKVWQLHAEL